MTLKCWILDSIADDWEDIEQIYNSVSSELINTDIDVSGQRFYIIRKAEFAPRLPDVVDEMEKMVVNGEIEFRIETSSTIFTQWSKAIPLLHCWFRPTTKGKALWEKWKLEQFGQGNETGPQRLCLDP